MAKTGSSRKGAGAPDGAGRQTLIRLKLPLNSRKYGDLTMSLPTPKLALILSCVAAWDAYALFSHAQSYAPGAQFSAVPIPTPVYPTNPYVEYKGPYGGYLSGAADVINSQGQFMTSQQQAYLTREQVKQASIGT